MNAMKKPWWQTATALVTVSASGAITGFSFVPGSAGTATSPAGLPLHLLAMDKAAHAELPGNARAAGGDPGGMDALLRSAIVNVARFYLWQAKTRTPAQVEALIWGEASLDGADHGESCAAFASLTLELAAQAVGQQSWVTGGDSYPWPLHSWADVRVDPNPASLRVTSIVQDARSHGRWHAAGDGYAPQPGDWVLFPGHVEVVTGYSNGVLDTIGADSLPGLTINAHAFSDPLPAQGVTGFVDNGHRAGTGSPAASPGPSATPRHAKSAPQAAPRTARPAATGGGPAQGRSGQPSAGARIPGIVAPEAAEIPVPAPAAAPKTAAPKTAAPKTAAPKTAAPKTAAPKTAAPKTAAPKTAAPKTAAPKTAAPRPYQRHTAAAPAAPGTRAQQAFINEIAPGATAAQRRFGVPASVTIAQAIEESAWGQSSLAAQQHNLFGIKGTGPAGSVLLPTQEYVGGQWETVRAPFRVYHNIAESIADHAELLATSGYYQRAMADRAVPDAFAHDLTGVYATDPEYGANLIALMRLYNLYRFDRPAPAAQAPAPQAPAPQPPAPQAPTGPPRAARAPGAAHSGTGVPGSGTRPPLVAGRPAGQARVPGIVTPPTVPGIGGVSGVGGVSAAGGVSGVAAAPWPAAPGKARGAALVPGVMAPPALTGAPRYQAELPRATATAFFATAKGPLARAEPLYRDVARQAGIRWELLAACDWMQCKAHPGRSPVHGEKLGTLNDDRTCFRTKSAALAQCASDLVQLAARVYRLDLTGTRALPVGAVADAFAAFRWGELLKRHHVSAMEFPYSVAGLTEQHLRMHWPDIDTRDAPDRPGARFRDAFGALPVVLSLGYQATV